MQSMFIETETTPNPASLKFLPGQQVMGQGTREFATPEAAEAMKKAQGGDPSYGKTVQGAKP